MTETESAGSKDSEDSLPFGALPDGSAGSKSTSTTRRKKKTVRKKKGRASSKEDADGDRAEASPARSRKKARSRSKPSADPDEVKAASETKTSPDTERRPAVHEDYEEAGGTRDDQDAQDRPRKRRRRRGRRNRRGKKGGTDKAQDGQSGSPQGQSDGERDEAPELHDKGQDSSGKGKVPVSAEGMFFLEKGQVSVLRHEENQWLSSKQDIYVPKKLVQKFKLRDGMIIAGPTSRGYKHKVQLDDVTTIDGESPVFWKNKPFFKNLTSIDPDFHYAVGDITDNVSMRVLDLIAPIGRGQRGLLVAPPRTGKTTLMREFAAGIEKGYPDVNLMVLLIDERPEEATEWKRNVENGKVFVSTADETPKNHIGLAEVVWRRATRLVEMGEDVVLLLDSITRLARAYNNQAGGSGRTMSGGLDSRAMERPRKFFGSARNTVEAGSLTIIGTTLVETGSRLDQLVFEEFKGTGNMEIVLNRKLADRRIFPAIDIEKSGTRKEEKLVGLKRLKLIHVLRRVLSRMHFAEGAELLITRLDDVEKTDDFLERFTVDPEA